MWRFNRLRCMEPAEIPFRVGRTLAAHAERFGLWNRESATSPVLQGSLPRWIHATAKVAAPNYTGAADRIASGRLDVFAMQNVDIGSVPRWNCDPKTGREAPLQFGKLLDYRDPAKLGDIKYLWEINRHMHLVTLAQAFSLSGDSRYSSCIKRHLNSWFAACPYRIGPNWSSALECGIRLINWSAVWQLIGGRGAALFAGNTGAAFRDRWLQSVCQHMRFIHGHYSRFSSANNHLIGEAAGVYIAALTWPFWAEHDRWRDEAAGILRREALLQNAPDGVNREQAVSYQQFELDLLLLALLAARAAGRTFGGEFEARIESMMEYLAAIMDVGGNMPMLGDSDDGFVVRLSQERGFCRYRSILATGALLFDRADFRDKADTLDDKSRWLFGPAADSEFENVENGRQRRAPKRAFRHGGCYILGCNFETAAEIHLVVDAGPLGYNSICAHGHADALAFTLSIGGREMLIDPGTYTYRPDTAWRAYFRGTAAHNTLRMDATDQSEPGGNFMWLRKANNRCSFWKTSPERDMFEGWHDGYTRLSDPAVHRRFIALDKSTRRIMIEDRVEMHGTHDIELFFHCAEHCSVEPTPYGFEIRHDDTVMELWLPDAFGASRQVYRGSVAPICGWVSRQFDAKLPSPTVVWRARVTGTTTLKTELRC